MDSTQRTRPRGGGSPVGLVIFIILTVVFVVLSYVGLAKYQEAAAQRSQAEAKVKQFEASNTKLTAEKEALQAASGAETAAALVEFAQGALEKSQEVGFGAGAEETATNAIAAMTAALGDIQSANTLLEQRNSEQQTKIAELEELNKAREAQLREEIKSKVSDIATLNKKLDDTIADLSGKIAAEVASRANERAAFYLKEDEWKDVEMRLFLKVSTLQEKLRELSGQEAVLEEPDGAIININYLNRWVTVDIGSESGVKPGMRFVAFTTDPSGNAVQKGVLETIKTEPTVAICSILSVYEGQTLGKGDFIFNLAGPEKKLFVFAGTPEKYPIEEWTNFIRANGGDVVAEVQKGDQVADYLILGSFEETDRRATELLRGARDFGLKILKEAELQKQMGII